MANKLHHLFLNSLLATNINSSETLNAPNNIRMTVGSAMLLPPGWFDMAPGQGNRENNEKANKRKVTIPTNPMLPTLKIVNHSGRRRGDRKSLQNPNMNSPATSANAAATASSVGSGDEVLPEIEKFENKRKQAPLAPATRASRAKLIAPSIFSQSGPCRGSASRAPQCGQNSASAATEVPQ
jgi:hypothetical protein